MDKARLKELALSAPKHELKADLDCFDDGVIEAGIISECQTIFFWCELGSVNDSETPWKDARENSIYKLAEYIAALDPETVLALLEENERLHAGKELLVKAVIDSFSGSKPLLTREQEDAVADMVQEYEETGVLDGA